MARTSDEKSKFLELLSATPQISIVAKKIGISRAAIYRWRDSDRDFRIKLEHALIMGRAQGVDVAEWQLQKQVQEGKLSAIKYYLEHNDPRYTPRRRISPITDQEEKERRDLERRNKPLSEERRKLILKAMENWGLLPPLPGGSERRET